MAQLLKRIVVAQRPNIIISDLGTGVYLKRTNDSVDLLNRPTTHGTDIRFTLEQVCNSKSLDSLLKTGYIKLYDENGNELSNLSGGEGERSTNLATLKDVSAGGVRGVFDYNDSLTSTTPISVTENEWTTITNDGAGVYSRTDYLPDNISPLLNSSKLDISNLSLGDSLLVRSDFLVTPTINGCYVELRLGFGSGFGRFYLTEQIGSLSNGAGVEYPIVVNSYFYIGSDDIKNNGVSFEIRCSDPCSLVNNGVSGIVFGHSI